MGSDLLSLPLALATAFCLPFASNSGFRCAPCTYRAARIESQTDPGPSIKHRLTNGEVIALSRQL